MRRSARARIVTGVALMAVLAGAPAQEVVPGTRIAVAEFSALAPGAPLPPSGWRLQTFRGVETHTRYAIVSDAGRPVLRAEASAAAAGLIRPLDAELGPQPRLAWRWKVSRAVRSGDPRTKSGDDYPARVYVTFRYTPGRPGGPGRIAAEAFRLAQGEYPPHATLVYVWDARQPTDTLLHNPYTDRARMIVVRGAGAALGEWREESRDLLADYRLAFGGDPPPVSGVAIMTDTDNTGDTAEAYYGDIVLIGVSAAGAALPVR